MRKFLVFLLLAIASGLLRTAGQEADQNTSLAETAAKAAANWATLARALDTKIARMLPCDPRLAAAIEEVSQASQARLIAANRVLEAAVAQARQDTETARAAVAAEQAAARDMETDRAEADQERIAIDSQLSDLSDSAKRRPVLAEAWNKLRTISEGAHAREADLEAKQKRHAELAGALNDLLEARAARQHALEAQLAAVALETTRWSDYYAARLARARTECDITNPTRSTRRKQ